MSTHCNCCCFRWYVFHKHTSIWLEHKYNTTNACQVMRLFTLLRYALAQHVKYSLLVIHIWYRQQCSVLKCEREFPHPIAPYRSASEHMIFWGIWLCFECYAYAVSAGMFYLDLRTPANVYTTCMPYIIYVYIKNVCTNLFI